MFSLATLVDGQATEMHMAYQAPGNRCTTSFLTCRRAEGPDSCCFSPALTADTSCQLMEKGILNPRVSAIVGWSFWWPFRESSLWPGWPQGIKCLCHLCGSLLCSSLLCCPSLLSHSVYWWNLGAHQGSLRTSAGPDFCLILHTWGEKETLPS